MAGHLQRSPNLAMLPEEERPVVARALAKNPAQRWANCRTFVEELRKVMSLDRFLPAFAGLSQTEPETATTTLPRLEKSRPRTRARMLRNGWSVAVAVTGIALLVLGVAVGRTWLHRPAEDGVPSATGEPPSSDQRGSGVAKPVLPASTSTPVALAYKQGLESFTAGDNKKAISAFTEAIRLDPKYGPAYVYRGWAYAHAHQGAKCLPDANMALRLLAKDDKFLTALAYYVRGHGDRYIGDNKAAIADYSTALRLRPNWAGAYHNRSIAYQKKGDMRRANADRKKADQLNHHS